MGKLSHRQRRHIIAITVSLAAAAAATAGGFLYLHRVELFVIPPLWREVREIYENEEREWRRDMGADLEHPYFAVTDEKGRYKIEGLPEGDYTLEAWHETYGKQETEITVGPSGSIEANFAFKPKE